MQYSQLISLYFDRSNALQWYWTIYVVVVGGLLAFSSLRQRADLVTGILVTVLFCFFAYKNLGAIGDLTLQRQALISSIRDFHSPDTTAAPARQLRDALEPTLVSPDFPGIRNFHIASDVLTVAALWAMEWRRRRYARIEGRAPDELLAAGAR